MIDTSYKLIKYNPMNTTDTSTTNQSESYSQNILALSEIIYV